MRRAIRLRWLGMVPTVAGCVVVLLAALLAGRLALERVATAAAERRVERFADVLSRRLASLPEGRRFALVEKAARAPNLVVALADADGLVHPRFEAEEVPAPRLRDWLVRERGVDGPLAFRALTLPPPLRHRQLVVATRLPTGPAFWNRFVWALVPSAIVLCLVGGLLAFSVFRGVAGTIDDLAARVRAMAAGPGGGARHEATEVPVLALDEVGDLARAVNRLAAHHRVEEERWAEARTRLDEADREKSEFLGIVSHQLRTPLNAILGFSQLLLAGVEGSLSESQREDIRIIEQSGEHLLGIINDILDLSAMESGRIDLSRVVVHTDVIAREVVRAAEGQLRGKPVQVRVDMRPTPQPVDADPKRVRQILTNLVANAVKFTAKGEVVVHARDLDAFVEVEVRDSGPGIPASELETIFESYAQLGDTKVRRRGTGLGLAICKRLVELHGGEIRAESTLGVGTSLFFTLPRAG